jgi:toxin FitB
LSRVILLDTGPLGMLVHKNPRPEIKMWSRAQLAARVELRIPDICDYELRRKLIHVDSTRSIQKLDELREDYGVIAITTDILMESSHLWSAIRKVGLATAPPDALDGDVILMAQARSIENLFDEVIIATTNVGHLNRLSTPKIIVKRWEDIT